MKQFARVFPSRTRATPIDNLSFIGDPPLLFPPQVDKINISVTFSWDLKEAERLEKQWRVIAPVEIGGPATGTKGADFIPGEYLKPGYVITSRGCNNKCWFCSVWKRDGRVRELPITEGHNILDDNLLSCSDNHIRAVFKMLRRQKENPTFTGGLEAAILKEWHVRELIKLNPTQMFFAYDTPNDKEPLFEAGELFRKNGFNMKSHKLRAYVLIGYPKDTLENAEERLIDTIKAGFLPYAMLYRDTSGVINKDWQSLRWDYSIHRRVASKRNKILDTPLTYSPNNAVLTYE